MKPKHATALAAAIAMLILILDGKTALAGAAEGIDLCVRVVIPTLFPFFFLTPVLVGNLSPGCLRPFGHWMGLPAGTEGILIPAFLGGYPTGAQAVGRAWQEGNLTKAEAERALHFCSNAGPSFLFGMIAPQFSTPLAPWILWGIHIVSALLVSRTIPKADTNRRASLTLPSVSIQNALSGAVKTMGLVCGWVVLFRIVIVFLNRWVFWLLPSEIRVIFCGVLELSNGCCMLTAISNEQIRFLIASVLLSLGGCCVAMQTSAVIPGLSILPYLKGKLMQTLYSLAFSAMILPNLRKWYLVIPGTLLFFYSIAAARKNSSSNIPAGVV